MVRQESLLCKRTFAAVHPASVDKSLLTPSLGETLRSKTGFLLEHLSGSVS